MRVFCSGGGNDQKPKLKSFCRVIAHVLLHLGVHLFSLISGSGSSFVFELHFVLNLFFVDVAAAHVVGVVVAVVVALCFLFQTMNALALPGGVHSSWRLCDVFKSLCCSACIFGRSFGEGYLQVVDSHRKAVVLFTPEFRGCSSASF